VATSPTKKISAAKKTPGRGTSGRPAGLFTWLAVGLVVVVIAALVIIKVAGGSSSSGGTSSFQASDPTVVAQVTKIPASIFNTVGVKSTVAQVTAPQALVGQPELTAKSSTGATVPQVFYLGAEYCPFCAAERWSTIIALSRFGTWSGLGNTQSSTLSGELYPATPTFTFLKAKFSSPYLAFRGIEQYTNVFSASLNYYTPLQKPTAAEVAIFKKYDSSKYIKGMTPAQDGSIPFLTMANKFLVSGASFTPATLTGLTRGAIASGLSDPTSPVTDAIIVSANYQTAALCSITKNQPGSVCTSSGVMAAKKVMKIK
jgi:thiol-disulfide isomerase/thioredoxin